LNSDAVVTPWSWWAPKDAFESDQTIGVTGPTTSYGRGEQVSRRAMHCRHYWNDTQICAFAEQYVAALKPRSWVDLPEVGGFAFFIRRHLWERLEGFDPNLPDYGNERELCMRIVERGLRVVWTRNSYIHHFGTQSYGRMGEELIGEKIHVAQDYISRKHNSGKR
jgi:GT2 family glycosyltransferase